MNEPRIYENVIRIPYSWTTGPVIGAFLTALRDEKKILGARCRECKKVWVPPSDVCAPCNADIEPGDLVPVSDEGVLTGFTRVAHELMWRPADPPYALVLIRLTGADTDLLHLVKTPSSLDRLEMGARVRARWKPERTGLITDIDEFELTSEGNP